MIIPAKDVGRVILDDLRAVAQAEFPDATAAEREAMIAEFLGLWAGAEFNSPMRG